MKTIQKKDLEKDILKALSQLRPFLHADGGDVDFVEFTNDNIVKIKLTGTCVNCNYNAMTKAGIEQSLKNAVPEIKKVVILSFDNKEFR